MYYWTLNKINHMMLAPTCLLSVLNFCMTILNKTDLSLTPIWYSETLKTLCLPAQPTTNIWYIIQVASPASKPFPLSTSILYCQSKTNVHNEYPCAVYKYLFNRMFHSLKFVIKYLLLYCSSYTIRSNYKRHQTFFTPDWESID